MNKTILFDNTKYSSVKDVKQSLLKIIYWVLRIFTVLMFFFSFIADFNPAKISDIAAYRNISLFTSAISFSKLTDEFLLGLDNHFVEYSTFIILRVSALIIILGILAIAIGGIISLGDKRKQKTASIFSLSGSIGMGLGIIGIYIAYLQFSNPNIPAQDLQFALDYLKPSFPWALILFMVFAIVFLALSITAFILVRLDKEDVVESVRKNIKLEQKYVLFFYAAPIVLLTFLFSYLPLYGWRYAFFNYESGGTLSFDNFVAFKWFSYLFENPQTVKNLLRAITNTLVMSGLGIAVSWLPVAFAVFFSEIKNKSLRKIIQTVTTVPNFISWILIYAVAISLFSSQGFLNIILTNFSGKQVSSNWLNQSGPSIWFQMLAWGVWKGVGWSAIIYLAAISGIDQELYEAASIDGARRFKKMWYITVPSLMPTFSVMLLLSFAGILSNGLEQYLVFHNSFNESNIEVLDLYIYRLLFDNSGNSTQMTPFSTVLSMMKSIISIILLFIANGVSKLIRGESII